MSETWIPFHASLRQGDKRGLPRSARFIFLELALLTRPTGGRLPLPRGFKSDLDAVHDILGGDRREIRVALELLSVPLDPTDPLDEPMIRVVGPKERRVLELPSHGRWVKADTSAERMRRLRDKQRQTERAFTDRCDVTCDVAGDDGSQNGVTPRGEERRGEEKRGEVHGVTSSVTPNASPTVAPTPVPPPAGLLFAQTRPPAEAQSQPKTRVGSSTRGARLREDWEPSPATIRRFREREQVDATACIERFKNFWLASSGRNAAKVDWERAFVNWVLEDLDKGKVPAVAPTQTAMPAKEYGPPVPPPPGAKEMLDAFLAPPPPPDFSFRGGRPA